MRNYVQFFQDNCYILGSGQSKWIPKQYISLYQKYNDKIRIFTSGIQNLSDPEVIEVIEVDPFLYSGSKNLVQTFPCILVYYKNDNLIPDNYKLIESDNNLIKILNKNIIQIIHNFETYNKLIRNCYLSML
jgi:hypothetical protein